MSPTGYPGALDTLTNPVAGDSTNSPSHALQHQNENDAIEAIETELGTNPSGVAATVAARFTALDALVAAVDAELTIGTSAPGSPTLGRVWIDTNLSPPSVKTWNGSSWVSATPAVSAPAVGSQQISNVVTTSTSYVNAGSGITLNVTKGRVLVILTFDVVWAYSLAAGAPTGRTPAIAIRVDSAAEAVERGYYGGMGGFDFTQTHDGTGHFVSSSSAGSAPVGHSLMYLFTGLSSSSHTFFARIKSVTGSTGNCGIYSGLMTAVEF